jgi:DNA-binding MarR family transcriptional regulator
VPRSKSDILVAFTRKIITVNTAYRQFIQNKLKENNVDLTFEMLQVLACLWQQDGINQQEIANITVKDKASMTYLLDNLTKRTLVKRQEDDSDRRNKLIFLTPKAKQLRTAIQPYLNDMYETAGLNIDTNMLKECMDVLDKIERNLKPE